MRRFCWILHRNPVYADRHGKPCELRFYAETIIALLREGRFDALDLVHLDDRNDSLTSMVPGSSTADLFRKIRHEVPEVRHIVLRSSDEDPGYRYDLGFLSTKTGFKNYRELRQFSDQVAQLAESIDQIIYGDSALELDEDQEIDRCTPTLLKLLRQNPDHPLFKKIQMVVTSEYPDNYLSRVNRELHLPSAFLPRLTLRIEFSPSSPRWSDRPVDFTFFRYFQGWWDRYLITLAHQLPDLQVRYFLTSHSKAFNRDRRELSAALASSSARLEIEPMKPWNATDLQRLMQQSKLSLAADRPLNKLTEVAHAGLSAGCALLLPRLHFNRGDEHYAYIMNAYLAKGGWAYDLASLVDPPLSSRLTPLLNENDWARQRHLQLEFYNHYAGIPGNLPRIRQILES